MKNGLINAHLTKRKAEEDYSKEQSIAGVEDTPIPARIEHSTQS